MPRYNREDVLAARETGWVGAGGGRESVFPRLIGIHKFNAGDWVEVSKQKKESWQARPKDWLTVRKDVKASK